MIYRIAPLPMTLSDLQSHSPLASLCKCDFFVQLYNSWQDFNWHSASRGPSAIAEPLAVIITSGQSNLTQGRIAAAHRRFNRIPRVAPICNPISIRTVPVLFPAESLWVYRPQTHSGIGRPPSWICKNWKCYPPIEFRESKCSCEDRSNRCIGAEIVDVVGVWTPQNFVRGCPTSQLFDSSI